MAYKKISGVYTIQNTVNSKIYVGCSINISKRINTHKIKLKRGVHDNIYLQRSWDKYGENSFLFSILDVYEEDYILSFENYWVNMLNSNNKKYGYNLKYTSPSRKSTRHSRETIEKIRKTKLKQSKKIILTEEEKLLRKKIGNKKTSKKFKELGIKPPPKPSIKTYCYNLNGNFIKEYSSIKEAADFLNIDGSALAKCMKGKKNVKSLGGFMWKNYKVNKIGKYFYKRGKHYE